jgi:hypothetical protein
VLFTKNYNSDQTKEDDTITVHGKTTDRENDSGLHLTQNRDLHLFPRVRMSGTLLLLLLYAFIAWRGTTLPFITDTSVCEAFGSHEIGSE